MVKIVAGKYKGHKLSTLSHDLVRPTSGIVRKSIFDSIGSIYDKTVLDLFGGIGSLSIEALSRGAKRVTIVEKDRKVSRVLSKNLNSICSNDTFIIHTYDVFSFIKREIETYDIIFADPPYSFSNHLGIRENIGSLLNTNGIFCMEVPKRIETDGFEEKVRRFGNTKVIFWRNKI